MKAIDKQIVIAADGKLPSDFREAFGRKARVIVHLQEDDYRETQGVSHPMDLVGKIRAFRKVDDPVAWQRTLRDSWKHGWDQ